MLAQRLFLGSTCVLVSLLAPNAGYAITVTTPIQTGATINGASPVNLTFSGFDNAFKLANNIPLNAVLTNVLLTAKGNTGGFVNLINTIPFSPAVVGSPGTLNLTVNGVSPIAQTNANSTPTIAGATLSPSYTPGADTATITPTAKTFSWNIFNGGTLSTAFNGPWYAGTVSLSSLSDFVAPIASGNFQEGVWSPPSTILPGDNSQFVLDTSLPTDTFLTYDYTVPAPPSSVPGPLPLLGAASAFGFSRRLRSRIKVSA